jgi:hypothetical protein
MRIFKIIFFIPNHALGRSIAKTSFWWAYFFLIAKSQKVSKKNAKNSNLYQNYYCTWTIDIAPREGFESICLCSSYFVSILVCI